MRDFAAPQNMLMRFQVSEAPKKVDQTFSIYRDCERKG